nr:MAG TPA: hypothetical protein [Caudoviricetes sp.]
MVGRGTVWQARRGLSRTGESGLGLARQARLGLAWRGLARYGTAGMARQVRVRQGKAWQAWLVKFGFGAAR